MNAEQLHLQVIPADLLRLLRDLMAHPRLTRFSLVGGTALALRLGHRRSMDIDLFTTSAFDSDELANVLQENFALGHISTASNSVTGSVGQTKLDLIAHRYPLIDQPLTMDGIRMLGMKDLAALKLNAITNRGSRKDFWDCADLLDYWSMNELLALYHEKYPHMNLWQVQKSLCYFDDAEREPDPEVLKHRTWEDVKSIIRSNCRF